MNNTTPASIDTITDIKEIDPLLDTVFDNGYKAYTGDKIIYIHYRKARFSFNTHGLTASDVLAICRMHKERIDNRNCGDLEEVQRAYYKDLNVLERVIRDNLNDIENEHLETLSELHRAYQERDQS